MILRSLPQFGQCSMSISNTLLSSLAHLGHTDLWCAQITSHSTGGVACAGGCGSCGKQHGCNQLGLCGQQKAQGDRQRQHLLAAHEG